MFGIHRRYEGQRSKPGINWGWDLCSQPAIICIFGRLEFYIRRRSNAIMSMGHKQRWLFYWGITKYNLSISPDKWFD